MNRDKFHTYGLLMTLCIIPLYGIKYIKNVKGNHNFAE